MLAEVLVLAGVITGQPEAKGKVAILDFSITGISETDAKKINEALGGEAAKAVSNLGYTVITTQDIRAMLGFERQKALLGCESDTSCLAEIGGALGADLIISGTIGKLGDAYSMSLTLLAADQAKIEGRFVGSAGSESALPVTIQRGVAILFGKKTDVSSTGILLVKTVPGDADVFIDGKPAGKSPVSIELRAGDHEVRATKGELTGSLSVSVTASGVARHELLLETPPVKLRVMSEPPEAEVFIDGKPAGKTPLILDDLPSGRKRVRIERAGYRPEETVLDLTSAAFEAQAREPFKHDIKLVRQFVVEPGVIGGAVFDVLSLTDDTFDGVSMFVEVTGEVANFFELGLGFTSPNGWHATTRFFFFQNGWELGAFLRVAYAKASLPAAPESVDRGTIIAPSVGATIGYAAETPIGRFGARIEGAAAIDLLRTTEREKPVWTAPLGFGAFWRFE